jgi:K+-transporting ATPase ATPase A chain
MAVLFALIRGFKSKKIGNFWRDIIRVTLYILIPLSFVFAIILISQGVVQTFLPSKTITTLQDGLSKILPLGPAAGQIAIKQLGTNGGGFFTANSAYPFENPTILSNLLETLAIIIIPASLCVTFGKALKKQGRIIYSVMMVLFAVSLCFMVFAEIGNMEGKEVMNGVGGSSLWAAVTTSASNGSVNSMLDSFSPVGGMVAMFLMQLGEIVLGGVGSGLYGMIAFVMLAVFIAGLMIGRTPEYLGKKLDPFDMKMVCVIILVSPILTLLGTAVTVLIPAASGWVTNTGAHGFSEILYAFTSTANNNGSAFAGYMSNTLYTNLTTGIMMLAARFIPMAAILFLAENFSRKKNVAASEGTLSTSNLTFALLLIAIILLVGALSFLPALALGPIAEYFTM